LKKRFFKKALAYKVYLAKRLFDSTVVLNLRKKHLISINGKKKFKRILVEGEKFKLRKLLSNDFIALFSSRRRACLVLKHNRVSEVFKGYKVHDFEYYGQRNDILKWKFNLSLEMCHLLLTLKIIRKSAQICDRCSLENFAMDGRFHSRQEV